LLWPALCCGRHFAVALFDLRGCASGELFKDWAHRDKTLQLWRIVSVILRIFFERSLLSPRFGTGTFTKAVAGAFGVPVSMPDGEQTLIELDRTEMDGKPPEVMTVYSALHWVHSQGKATIKMSFFDVERVSGSKNGETYKLTTSDEGAHIYKLLSDEEIKALQVSEMAKKKSKGEGPAPINLNASTIFGSLAQSMPTVALQTAFRYRVLVGKALKIAKPYVVTKRVIKLKPNMPQQVA